MTLSPWKLVLVGSALAGAAYLVVDDELVREAVWRLNLLAACGSIAWGVRLHRPSHRTPWYVVLAALAILAGVNLGTYPAWGTSVAQALADPLAALAFPLIGVSAMMLFRHQAPGGDRESAIDGLIVMVAMAAVLTGTAFHPDRLASDISWAGMLVNSIVAPLTMAAVTAATFRLLFVGSVRNASAWFIVVASASALIGNTMRALLGSQGTYERGTWWDLFILAAYATVGLAALHPSMTRLTERGEYGGARFTNARLIVLGVALLAAPLTLIIQEPGSRATIPIVASIALTVLVMARLGQLVSERERARHELQRRAERQEALAQLGLRAIDASDLDALFAAAVDTIGEVVDVRSAEVVRGTHPTLPAAGVGGAQERAASAGGGGPLAFSLADGSTLLAAPANDDGDTVAFLQSVANVLTGAIERNRAQETLREQAVYDALTGLPNRILLLDRLEHDLATCRRDGGELVVMFLDLDGFKRVNDDHGHRAGDDLLVAVAQRLQATVRETDTVGRLAGDEFVIVGAGAEPDELRGLAERLVVALARPFRELGGSAGVAASIGVVVADGTETDPERLLAEADAAMYEAKRRPGGAVEVFDEELGHERRRRRQLEHDLVAALDRDDHEELRLVYQPLVHSTDADGAEVVGAEALLRWTHPTSGPCSPGVFIPIAETSDLIVRLGDRVIVDACAQLARWQADLDEERPFTLYVNLASRQLADPRLPRRVAEILAATGVEPARLGFEVSETAMIDAEASMVATDLRRLGVRLALDDFGTGYTSISQLKRLPLDLIKLDGSLVAGAVDNAEDRAIVRAIIAVATELGIEVLAEQVETTEQLDRMRSLGCDLIQGYLFAAPGPAEQVQVATPLTPMAPV